MADVSNPETIYSALKALSLLRATVGDVFKHLANVPQFNTTVSESEQQQSKEVHKTDLISITSHINLRFRELETAITLLNPMAPNSISLGNTGLVGQDPNYDKTSLYPDMLISYRWLDNMQEYSLFAYQALTANFTKRNSMVKSRKNLRNQANHNNHIISPQNIDYLASQMQRSFDISIEVVRPFGVFSILKIILDRTLRAVIVLRGFVIQWVLVKGFEETFEEMNPANLNKIEKRHPHQYMANMADMSSAKLDIWSPSRYQIFRTITDHANAAILHFYAPYQMESAIKAFTNWLKSYSNLFLAKCRKCDTRLMNNMPPTWRDFRTNEPYHFECRP